MPLESSSQQIINTTEYDIQDQSLEGQSDEVAMESNSHLHSLAVLSLPALDGLCLKALAVMTGRLVLKVLEDGNNPEINKNTPNDNKKRHKKTIH